MLTVVAFVVALGLLIAVHELLGRRMRLRYQGSLFSIGFQVSAGLDAAPATCCDPRISSSGELLGGYVKMLDARSGRRLELHRAFNRRCARSAIVAANLRS